MKLAAKQLLALGVKPQQIRQLDDAAEERDLELRQLVQFIIRSWLLGNRAS